MGLLENKCGVVTGAGQGIGRHRLYTVGGNQYPGAEANALGLGRRQCHADEDVRVEQLCVIEPGRVKTERLRLLDMPPGLRV